MLLPSHEQSLRKCLEFTTSGSFCSHFSQESVLECSCLLLHASVVVLLEHASASQLEPAPEGTNGSAHVGCSLFSFLAVCRKRSGTRVSWAAGAELLRCFENNCLTRTAVIKELEILGMFVRLGLHSHADGFQPCTKKRGSALLINSRQKFAMQKLETN